MPRNSSGVYTLPSADYVAQTTISSSAVNADYSDIASTITTSLATTGVSVMTGGLKGYTGTAALPSYVMVTNLTTGWYSISAGVWGFSAAGVNVITASATSLALTAANFIDRNALNVVGLPIGLVTDYPVAVAPWTAPSGWLYCYGQTVSRTTYALLFAAIGTTFGIGDGSTTFTIPDTRGYVLAGPDNMGGTPAGRLNNASAGGVNGLAVGNVGGGQTLTLLQANMPSANVSNTIGVTLTNNTNINNAGFLTSGNIAGGGATPYEAGGAQTVGATFTGAISSGGSASPMNIVQPTIIVAYMIYAGV